MLLILILVLLSYIYIITYIKILYITGWLPHHSQNCLKTYLYGRI